MQHVAKLLYLGLLVVAVATSVICGPPAYAQEEAATEAETDVMQLLDDIGFLEGITRLDLTSDQVKALVPHVAAVHEAFSKADEDRRAALEAMRPTLEKRRDLLIKGMVTPADLENALDQGFAELAERNDQLAQEMARLGRQIQGILTDEQIVLALGDGAWLLETAKDWSDDDFDELAEAYASELAAQDPTGKLTVEEALAVLETAHGMPDEEFRESVDELVRTLAPALAQESREHPDRLADVFSYPRAPQLLQEMAEPSEN